MKLHQKAFLLVELNKASIAWDYDLISKAMKEYGLSGPYWTNAIRAALDELSSAGLTNGIDKKLDDGTHVGKDKVLFKYQLTEFGRTRMRETGLL